MNLSIKNHSGVLNTLSFILLLCLPLMACSEIDSIECFYELNGGINKLSIPFRVGQEAFNQSGGHIQGLAASENALYLSQNNHIAKVSWDGKLIKSIDAINHTGDLFWYNGELFSAVALGETVNNQGVGEGRIVVYDSDLNILREARVSRRIDGICCFNGVLYIGMGSKTQPSSEPHRVNLIGKYDIETLEEIDNSIEIDYGYNTIYGVENLTSDGTFIYASFYAASGPCIVKFDADFHVVGTFFKPAYHGLDLLPASLCKTANVFIWSETRYLHASNGITCTINIWRPTRE